MTIKISNPESAKLVSNIYTDRTNYLDLVKNTTHRFAGVSCSTKTSYQEIVWSLEEGIRKKDIFRDFGSPILNPKFNISEIYSDSCYHNCTIFEPVNKEADKQHPLWTHNGTHLIKMMTTSYKMAASGDETLVANAFSNLTHNINLLTNQAYPIDFLSCPYGLTSRQLIMWRFNGFTRTDEYSDLSEPILNPVFDLKRLNVGKNTTTIEIDVTGENTEWSFNGTHLYNKDSGKITRISNPKRITYRRNYYLNGTHQIDLMTGNVHPKETRAFRKVQQVDCSIDDDEKVYRQDTYLDIEVPILKPNCDLSFTYPTEGLPNSTRIFVTPPTRGPEMTIGYTRPIKQTTGPNQWGETTSIFQDQPQSLSTGGEKPSVQTRPGTTKPTKSPTSHSTRCSFFDFKVKIYCKSFQVLQIQKQNIRKSLFFKC
jgi:hypothetical protein